MKVKITKEQDALFRRIAGKDDPRMLSPAEFEQRLKVVQAGDLLSVLYEGYRERPGAKLTLPEFKQWLIGQGFKVRCDFNGEDYVEGLWLKKKGPASCRAPKV
jgi:hypothetical protein